MHYYSYKLEDIMSMEAVDYANLVELMHINEARDRLFKYQASIYPKVKDSKREEIFRKTYKVAYPKNFEVKNVVKLSDLNKVLK